MLAREAPQSALNSDGYTDKEITDRYGEFPHDVDHAAPNNSNRQQERRLHDAPVKKITEDYVAVPQEIFDKLIEGLRRQQTNPKAWRVHIFVISGPTRKQGWSNIEYADDQLGADALCKARICEQLKLAEFDELWTSVERAYVRSTIV